MTDWISKFKEYTYADSVGEIISSSHAGFKFQAYELKKIPAYPSIVAVFTGNEITIGIIIKEEMRPKLTIPSEPTLLKQKREQWMINYVDIQDKLVIICEAVTIGYYKERKFYQERPRNIPWIHDLVFIPDKEFIKEMHKENGQFFLKYLPIIFYSIPANEQGLFNYFLNSFFNYLSQYFNKSEIMEMLKSLQESFEKNNLSEYILTVDEILARI